MVQNKPQMAAENFTNNSVINLSGSKATLPASSSGSGTFTTDGKRLNGTNTKFATELPINSWVFDLTNNEFRQIERCDSDTLAWIRQPFSNVLTDLAVVKISNTDGISCENFISSVSGTVTLVTNQEAIIPNGVSISLSKSSRTRSGKNDIVDPCIIDATNGVAVIGNIT